MLIDIGLKPYQCLFLQHIALHFPAHKKRQST